jgi:hypothetical protein
LIEEETHNLKLWRLGHGHEVLTQRRGGQKFLEIRYLRIF